MAKKNVSRINNGWFRKVESYGPDKVEMKILGTNTAGTDCECTITISDWDMIDIVRKFRAISRKRMDTANQLSNNLKDAIL